MEARNTAQKRSSDASTVQIPSNWLRRWWPALIPAGLCLVCMAAIAVQQSQIQSVQHAIDTLRQTLTNELNRASRDSGAGIPGAHRQSAPGEEIAQLREIAQRLRLEIAGLEKLQTENRELQRELQTPAGLSPEETEAVTRARERAEEISCVNNMKQLGLAVRIWASDHADQYPPNVICMSNEMNTTRILLCPSDRTRQLAPDFNRFTLENCSYDWFLDPPGSDTEPFRTLTRCPVHGHVGLYDGSVQMRIAKEHPEWLKQRDGRLYLEPPGRPAN